MGQVPIVLGLIQMLFETLLEMIYTVGNYIQYD